MKIATPISNLFEDDEAAELIIKFSDCLECRDHSIDIEFAGQELFHCGLQPIHNLCDENFKYLEKIKTQKKELKHISFHLASCYENPKLSNGMFIPNGSKLSRDRMSNNASKNFSVIREIFGKGVKLSVENNNYYPTPAYEVITDADFIFEIVQTNHINFLLDISHAVITTFHKGISLNNYLNALPIDKIVQLHISKTRRNNNNELYDAHVFPDKEFLKSIEHFFMIPKLEYATIEYYENANKLIESISYLKEIIDEKRLSN